MLDQFSALRSERTVEISPRLGFAADGPNWAKWAESAFWAARKGEILGLFRSFSPVSSYKAFFFTVFNVLSLI